MKIGTVFIIVFASILFVVALIYFAIQFQPPGNLPPNDTAAVLAAIGLVLLGLAYAHERS